MKINFISNNDKAMRANGKLITHIAYTIKFGDNFKFSMNTKSEEEKNNVITRLKRDKVKFKVIRKNLF